MKPLIGAPLPRAFILSKPGACEKLSLYPDVPVFKVVNKILP